VVDDFVENRVFAADALGFSAIRYAIVTNLDMSIGPGNPSLSAIVCNSASL
jgi:hypothetical protein